MHFTMVVFIQATVQLYIPDLLTDAGYLVNSLCELKNKQGEKQMRVRLATLTLCNTSEFVREFNKKELL